MRTPGHDKELAARLLPLSHFVMMVSGRRGIEIVQKALAAGSPAAPITSFPARTPPASRCKLKPRTSENEPARLVNLLVL
jgi:hypothetical protein